MLSMLACDKNAWSTTKTLRTVVMSHRERSYTGSRKRRTVCWITVWCRLTALVRASNFNELRHETVSVRPFLSQKLKTNCITYVNFNRCNRTRNKSPSIFSLTQRSNVSVRHAIIADHRKFTKSCVKVNFGWIFRCLLTRPILLMPAWDAYANRLLLQRCGKCPDLGLQRIKPY